MTIQFKFATTLLTAGAIAATLISAPAASADPTTPDCQRVGVSTTQCSTNGSVSIKAVPPVQAPPAAPYQPGRGGFGSPGSPVGGRFNR